MIKRVLICGNPDLNYIDGSSIWAQTIALVTAATGIAEVDFLAKSRPEREELFGPLKATYKLKILDGTDCRYWQGKNFKRLTLSMMAELAVKLDRTNPYDVIIVRGLDIATELLDSPDVLEKCWMYLTDIPQSLETCNSTQRRIMEQIAHGCRCLLCQTEGFKAQWQALIPELSSEKLRLYTPVIPDFLDSLTPIKERPIRAIYAGKFKGDWMTLEMADNWPAVLQKVPGSELLMIGDKIHKELDCPDYQQKMKDALMNTQGLRWLGAQPRKSVQQELQQARVGLSWRAESMNNTMEYSTKILEYGGAGCAAILNRNPLHEKLLGQDYPLFANSTEEFIHQLIRALNEPKVADQAAGVLRRLAERHTFSSRVDEFRHWLAETPKAPRHVSERYIFSTKVGKSHRWFAEIVKVCRRFVNRHVLTSIEGKIRNLLVKVLVFCKRLAKNRIFSNKLRKTDQLLAEVPKVSNKTRVLVAGHDLKFFALLRKQFEATGKFEFIVDQWKGHNRHDKTKSLALLKQADVIFCEWCLGNLKWYSHNKRPEQRLVARFHAQEVRLPYMEKSNWDNINHISFVSAHIQRQALTVCQGFPIEKTSVIPNYLDDKKFTFKKKTREARYTLGMVGVTPKSKRLDRALDLLESLLEEDDRYCLRIKGKHPLDYAWLLKREDELAYYTQIFKRINSSRKLRHRVIFDPPGDNVNDWFTMVGFILSPSDFESFHMAIGEGMLTGAVPIIWNWEGASEIWGDKWVVKSLEEAKKIVMNSECSDDFRKYVKNTFPSRETSRCWIRLIQKN